MDPGVGAARAAEADSFRCLEPLSPVGLVGVGLSCVHYPILGFSQPEGLSFVACPDRSGLE